MSSIKLFESKKVRSHWDEKEEQWYFSVIDVVEILTDSPDPKDYWYRMKKREKLSGFELSTICRQLKLESSDGKKYATDCSNTQGLLRIIQSIPSPKAEPFKQWLAKVGYERMQEISDPGQSIDRARENWQKLGHSEKWIQQRMTGQETRNKLTDYWKESGVEKSDEFALLTNIIHQEWTGLTVKKHKDLKGLKSQNLRDHITTSTNHHIITSSNQLIMKTITLLVIILLDIGLFVQPTQAQQTPATAGGTLFNGSGSISYTIGESVAQTLTNANVILTQGFHQPILSVVVVQALSGLGYTVSTFPNPTSDFVWLKIDKPSVVGLQYLLFDFKGTLLAQKYLETNEMVVPFNHLNTGVYLLKVQDGLKEVKTFKIIKY